MEIFPQIGVKNKKSLKAPPSKGFRIVHPNPPPGCDQTIILCQIGDGHVIEGEAFCLHTSPGWWCFFCCCLFVALEILAHRTSDDDHWGVLHHRNETQGPLTILKRWARIPRVGVWCLKREVFYSMPLIITLMRPDLQEVVLIEGSEWTTPRMHEQINTSKCTDHPSISQRIHVWCIYLPTFGSCWW